MQGTKRRRLYITVKASTVWQEILRVWTKLHKTPMLKDDSNLNCSRFLVKAPNEVVIEIQQQITEGQHSEIYQVFINGQEQNVILKKFKSKSSENLTPTLEALAQIYACKHGFAVPVLAFNQQALISVKCDKQITQDPLEIGYKWQRNMMKDHQTKFFAKKLNTLSIALSPGSQNILDFSRKMYSKIGMYNMDQNPNNYMIWNDKMVQIDFGMNRFASKEHLKRFFQSVGRTDSFADSFADKDVAKLVPQNMPHSPHEFYWYQAFVSNGQCDPSMWNSKDWESFHMQMPIDRQTYMVNIQQRMRIIKDIQSQKSTKRPSSNKKTKIKIYALKDNHP
jgi:hypothetical protein